ncbi:MAG TPA: MBL fold metallo-hydrolase [Thermoanaerobaculia bacterium]|nr:MBL fold metallo-hydrolase [Thermoanaerobaculia bacterium]
MFLIRSQGPLTRVRMARTLFGKPLHEVSAYAFADLLIDSGPPPTASELVSWARGRPEIARVVLTHHHEDHVGGAAALQEGLGLPVMAPASAVAILAEGLRMPLYRKAVWSTPRRFRAEPLGPVVEGDGYRLRVVPTPGHAFTHVCLFDEERRWLFSGDLYVHERVRYLRKIENVWEHIDSLRRVIALEPDLLICAHAGVLEHAQERLSRKIRWWEDLAGQARELREKGLSVPAVSRALLGRDGLLSYASFGDFSHKNLIRSLLSKPRT